MEVWGVGGCGGKVVASLVTTSVDDDDGGGGGAVVGSVAVISVGARSFNWVTWEGGSAALPDTCSPEMVVGCVCDEDDGGRV